MAKRDLSGMLRKNPGAPKKFDNVDSKGRPRVNKDEALRLKVESGLSYKEIAKIQGVTPAAICKAIKHMLPTEETEIFKKNRADIFANMQMKMLSSIDDRDIKKSPMGSRVLAACQLYDKERLERGKATSHVEVHEMMFWLKRMDHLKEIEAEEAEVIIDG